MSDEAKPTCICTRSDCLDNHPDRKCPVCRELPEGDDCALAVSLYPEETA